MKKSNLLTTAAAVMLLTAAPAAAQTCIKTPSCADLGYTKTAADCAGKTILKCPLDNTQVYCPGYEETLRTYKVGDPYEDSNGIGIGKVVEITDKGRHGLIAIAGGEGTLEHAQTTCNNKKSGGLEWALGGVSAVCATVRLGQSSLENYHGTQLSGGCLSSLGQSCSPQAICSFACEAHF